MENENLKPHVNDWLNAALKRYGEAEPQPGLETRVLAGVREERKRIAARGFNWWPALATFGAMLLVGMVIFLMSKPQTSVRIPMTNSVGVEVPNERSEKSQASNRIPGTGLRPSVVPAHRLRIKGRVTAPHLKQFPSPQPLSEQEKILARYVLQFPHEAILVARAQTELLEKERLDELDLQSTNPLPENSEEEKP